MDGLMSEKSYKKVVEELTDEVRSLKFVCSRLADTIEQDLKLRVTQEQYLTGIHEILTRMANASITIDGKVLQSFYAMVTNAINDTGLLKTLHRLDDVLYRLSERLKEMVAIRKEDQLEARRLRRKIEEKLEEG
jgi:uncharacterized protein YfeS